MIESYRKLKIISWIIGISGFVTFLVGCWFTYTGFYHPSQEEYENEKKEHKFIYQNNGTRIEFNGLYGPKSLVVGCSFLAVIAGFIQAINALVMLYSRPMKKAMRKTGNYIIINGFITVALVLNLIVSIVTDPARSYENPTEEIQKNFLTFLVQGKNSFAIVLGCNVVLIIFSMLYLSILYRRVNLYTNI